MPEPLVEENRPMTWLLLIVAHFLVPREEGCEREPAISNQGTDVAKRCGH
jgi:hypothetical protein